jgi:tetratricopeptide (TPR) repeat protein
MHAFDSKDVKRLFGLTDTAVRALVRAGHLHPTRQGSRVTYSFQDLVVLRAAAALRAARVPPAKIHAALRRITANPGRLSGDVPDDPLESGATQLELRLEVVQTRNNIRSIGPSGKTTTMMVSAQEHFERALGLEATDGVAACAAYEASLQADPRHLEARVNLGRLLHLAGLLLDAERVYRDAHTPSALLSFNLAIVLEDLGREDEAIRVYREALAHDPDMADAHFNIARLHERAGDAKASFRHLLAYRRLSADMGTR